jgi:hypothetical protein
VPPGLRPKCWLLMRATAFSECPKSQRSPKQWLRSTSGLLGTTPRFRDDDYGGLVSLKDRIVASLADWRTRQSCIELEN